MIEVQEKVIVKKHTLKRSVFKAAHLKNLIEIMFSELEDPENPSFRIQKALLAKEKQTSCYRCHHELSLEGYQITHTNYSSKEALDCLECPTTYLLSEVIFS